LKKIQIIVEYEEIFQFPERRKSIDGNTGILVRNRRCPHSAGVPFKGGEDPCKDILKHILAKS
jgi:hypothetical protein